MEERRALEKIALITASPVRVAIVSKLDMENPESYAELKSSVEKSLRRDVSDGSFAWHLEKLKGAGLVEKSPIPTFDIWSIEEASSEESKEEEEVKEKFPKKVSKDLTIGQYRIEGYRLTKEGNEIKDAVRAAINKLKPPS